MRTAGPDQNDISSIANCKAGALLGKNLVVRTNHTLRAVYCCVYIWILVVDAIECQRIPVDKNSARAQRVATEILASFHQRSSAFRLDTRAPLRKYIFRLMVL